MSNGGVDCANRVIVLYAGGGHVQFYNHKNGCISSFAKHK